DYIVDYARGQITFTARRPIHPGSRIAVDYQYAADQFRRSLYMSRGELRAGADQKSGLFVSFMREADDPGHPLGQALTTDDVSALRGGSSGGTVVTEGAHLVGAGHGDYRKIPAVDSLPEHFQWAGRDSGDYEVDFMLAKDGQGAYADSL